RCHGPGSVHVERRNRDREPLAGIDYSIVNPAHLPRELAEAVCQQCHLRPGARILARGRKPSDFRPGLPLQDVRHTYSLDSPEDAMTVVGHVEQLHLSRCYKESKTLTCSTCHNPHHKPEPEKLEVHSNASCLNCHQPTRCTVPKARREKESPSNSCVQCHMPTAPTEIVHFAFTHHRIGIHAKPTQAKPTKVDGVPAAKGPAKLQPFMDLSRFSEIDRIRSVGLAYLEAADREDDAIRKAVFRKE